MAASPATSPPREEAIPLSSILGDAFVRIRPDTTGFKSEAESGIGRALSGLGDLAKKAMIPLGAAMAAAGGIGIKTASQIEQANIGFTQMLGSGQKAQAFLKQLQTFAAKTPFEFTDVTRASQRLMAMGIQAKDVIPYLTSIGDAVAGLGGGKEQIDQVTTAIGQMTAKGKIQGDEILQLTEAGIPALKILADTYGVSTGQMSDMISKGQVLSDKAVPALIAGMENGTKSVQGFGGMMAAQSQSMAGLFSTLKDTVAIDLANMMLPLIPSIKGAMNAAVPVLDSALSTIGNKFAVLAQQIPNLFSAIKASDFQGIGEVLDNIFGNTGTKVAFFRDMAQQLLPVLGQVKDLFVNLWGVAQNLGPVLGVGLAGSGRLLWEVFKNLLPLLVQFSGFLADNQWAAVALAGAFVALRLAVLAHDAAMVVAAAGGMAQWITQVNIVQALTKAWTAVQWALNVALDANPIVLIGIAIAALVAGLVIAWKNSETFRDVVTGALHAVGDAGVWMWEHALKPAWDALAAAMNWLWNSVLSPTFGAITAGWNALVTGIQWYWQNILEPVLNFFGETAKILLAVLTVAVFGPILVAWKLLVAGMEWAWSNILKPAWEALQTAAQWMWNNVLSPVFAAIGVGWNGLLTGIDWAWNNILKPAWTILQTAAQWLWNNVLSPVFGAIGGAWDGLMRGMKSVYDSVIHPVWKIFSDAVGAVKSAFDAAIAGIKWAWDQIQEIAAKPIRFVVNTVLNDGLFKAFNWVIDTLGLNKDWHINPIKLGFATGGQVPGYSPNDRADNIPAMLTAGEWVHPVAAANYYGDDVMEGIRSRRIPREALQGALHRADGGPVYQQLFNRVKQQFPRARMNDGFRPGASDLHGKGLAVDLGEEGFSGGNGRPYLAQMNQWLYDNFKSGILELIYDGAGDNRPDIKNGADHAYNAATQAQHHNHVHLAAQSLAAMLGGKGGGGGGGGVDFFDALGKLKDAVTAPMQGFLGSFGDSTLTKIVSEVPGQLVGKAWDKIKDAVSDAFSAFVLTGQDREVADTGGIKSDVSAVAQNRGWQIGTSQWPAIDWIVSKESGWNPKAQNPSSTASGLFQQIDGTWMANRPIGSAAKHMKDARVVEQAQAGLKYIADRYKTPLGAQAFWKSHNYYHDGGKVSLYDGGGVLNHGDAGVNRSGKPEAVFTYDQWKKVDALIAGGGGQAPLIGQLTIHPTAGESTRDQLNEVNFQVRRLGRGGAHARR